MPRYSVKRPMTVIVCAVLVLALGILSFTKMQTNLLPEFELPYVVVYTAYPGANPEKVEVAVTQPLESVLSTTGGLSDMTSVSSENSSMILMEFAYSTNMDSAMIEINSNIEMVKGYLDDAVSTPYVVQIDPDMLPVLVAAVDYEDMDSLDISAFVSDDLLPALERVEGVADITAMGSVTESLEITLSHDAISELNARLVAAVDEELAETQQELLDGYDEIDDGRSALSKELRAQKRALDEALAELKTGLSDIDTNRDILKGKLAQAKSALSQLTSARESLQQLIVGYDGLDALRTQKAQLEAALPLIPPASATDIAAAQAAIAALDAQITAIESAAAGSTQAQRLVQLDELTKQIAEVNAGIVQLEAAITQLNTAEQELESSVEQVEAGYDQLDDARDDAEARLDDAEAQLDEAQEQFDEAADEALRAADLGGLVTESTIAQILAAQNLSMPAGYAAEGDARYTVKVGDEFSSIAELEELLLFNMETADIGDVRLGDIATVALVNDADTSYAKINGRDGILLVVQKQSSFSTTEVSSALQDAIDRLMADNPGLTITTLSDQGVYINIITGSVLKNLLMGGALAVLMLLIFLRSARPTFIVALSIPLSLMLAVTLMYFTGISLNLISLAGLALGIGMLVDNSIVVIENTYRLRAAGLSPAKAAVQGAREVGGAITASTLTTICVFLPIVFSEGIARELFVDMGLTIAYSLLASLLVAMTLVPATGSMLLVKEAPEPGAFYKRLVSAYQRSLRFALSHKALILIPVCALLIVSVYAAAVSGTAFMPKSDTSQIVANIEFDASRELTSSEKRKLEDTLSDAVRAIDGVAVVGAMESSTSGMSLSGGDAMFYILLEDGRTLTSDEIGAKIIDAAADMPVTVSISSGNMDISMLSGTGIEVNVYGAELDTLRDSAREIADILSSVPGIQYVDDGTGDPGTEQRIAVDKEAAVRYKLTVAQVYAQVAARLDSELPATNVTIDGTDLSVIIAQDRLPTRSGLADIVITGTDADGREIDLRLGDIATITEAETASSISRSNNKRMISVTATLASGENIGLVSAAAEAALASYALPDGYTMEFSGENATINDTLKEVGNMALLALLLIYLIMVAQFQSLLSPFIVMFTIPLAFTGGLLLEWACGFELSVISALGLLVLLGVVVNNGIVFVDCANGVYRESSDRREALCLTGARRMRPILMTALTTVLGLMTLAFGAGAGADMLQPMAVVIIGGLAYGTLLTLYVIPILYDSFVRKPPKAVDIE